VDYSTISEMAKWLEHHVRDYQQAKDLVEKTLNQNQDLSAEQIDSLLHRLKRLNTKLEGTK
jgi:hypothetical protein